MAFSRHRIIWRAVQDISHGDTRSGLDNQTNERLFMQTTKTIDGDTFVVPEISGNALRSVVFRRTLANDLMDRLEMKAGDLSPAVHDLFYNGGVLGGVMPTIESGEKKESKKVEFDVLPLVLKIRKLYPSLDLIGGSTDYFTLKRGRLNSVAAWPMLAEYAEDIQDIAPGVDTEKLPRSYDVLNMKTRTSQAQEARDSNIYTYQVLASGVKILSEITFESGTPGVTKAAAGVALRDFDLFFGGQARQGHGRLVYEERPDIETAAYEEHVEENREQMKAGILDGTLGTGKVVCGS